ncbi:DUF6470 family protein [Marinicrinis sediminis]|uniref:DUF6470 family protein n=1 Tax=Marinicrinis sediminis TaxID=1652465 RepID=A0ABW5RB80_9BACL
MIPFPMIRMQQVQGRIGIESQAARIEIRQKPAELSIQTTQAKLEIQNARVEMQIDQSRAHEALTGGKPMPFMERIYSQIPSIALQAIAKKVEDGNRMAAITKPGNTIEEIAYENAMDTGTKLDIYGPASYDNVDIFFTLHKAEVAVQPGSVQIDWQTNQPTIDYVEGMVNVYVKQQASLTITPPEINRLA